MSQHRRSASHDLLRRATPPPARDARGARHGAVTQLAGRRAAALLVVAALVATAAWLERALTEPGPAPLWLVLLAAVGAAGVGVALRRLDDATASGRPGPAASPRRRAAAEGWRSLARRAD